MKVVFVLWLQFFCVAFLVINTDLVHARYKNVYLDLNDHLKDSLQKNARVDFLMEDDHGDFDLADIISLSAGKIDDNIDRYSNLEKMIFTDFHNIYRSNLTKPLPKGSDVEYVEWNNTLAWAAEDWLKQCEYKHGFGAHDNMTTQQGQNMYKGPSMLPSRPTYLWYEEYKYFDFSNFTCKGPHPQYCAHMTQILWSDSSNIGCARKSYCWPTEPRYKMVNCHYIRAGNVWDPGNQIYKYGWQCTRCELNDGNLCIRGLCVDKRICKAYNLDCECKLDCKNCVKPNPKQCRCESCKSGWDWKDCSFPCVNLFDMAKDKPGYCQWKVNKKGIKKQPRNLCNKVEISRACRRSCDNCKALNLTDKANLCCDGKMCPLYHVLDENCECKVDCPSKLCLYPPSTTTKYPILPETTTLSPTTDSNEHVNKTKLPGRKQVKAPADRLTCVIARFIFIATSILLL